MGAQTGSHIEVIPGSIDLILLMYHFVIFNIVYAVCVSDVSGVYVMVSILMSQNAISNG